MKQETAWQVIRTVFRCSADLQSLLKVLKEECDPQNYRRYAAAVAASVDAINVQLMDRALNEHPDLRQRIE